MISLLLAAIVSLPATKAGDGTCGYWKEKYVAASRLQTNATGPTPTLYGTTAAVTGLLLDATTEYVYFVLHVDDMDWDSTSNVVFKVQQILAGAETANDTIDGEIVCDYLAADHGDFDATKTQTRSVSHDIGANTSAGVNHRVVYVFDRTLASNNIVANDRMYCRYRLSSVAAGKVQAVIVLEIAMYYRTCYPAEVVGTFPTEG